MIVIWVLDNWFALILLPCFGSYVIAICDLPCLLHTNKVRKPIRKVTYMPSPIPLSSCFTSPLAHPPGPLLHLCCAALATCTPSSTWHQPLIYLPACLQANKTCNFLPASLMVVESQQVMASNFLLNDPWSRPVGMVAIAFSKWSCDIMFYDCHLMMEIPAPIAFVTQGLSVILI